MSLYTLNLNDESGESSTVSFHTPEINVGNFAAYFGDTGVGAEQDLIDAVRAFSGGALVSRRASILHGDGEADPVDPNFQRERKLLVRYRDAAQGKVHGFEIPIYNMVAKIPGTDQIDTTSAEWVALQAALDLYVGADGGAITLLSGTVVGRNL